MRISTQQIYSTGLNGVLDTHAQVGRTQEQITTGKRVLRPSDDPVAAVRIQQVGQQIASAEQYNENIGMATTKLSEEENLLDTAENIIQRIKEKVIQSENAALSTLDRVAIAAEIEERLGELFNITNTRDAAGKYIFGGYNGSEPPFVARPGGGYSYEGDGGRNKIQFASNSLVDLNDSGKEVFASIAVKQGSFDTRASSNNTSVPPARISAGQVTDQIAFMGGDAGDAYTLTFNALADVTPPASNYTITRVSDGTVVGEPNQLYQDVEDLEVNRKRFQLPASPAVLPAPGDSFTSFDSLAGEDYQLVFNNEVDIVPNGPNFTIMRKSDGTTVGEPNRAYTSNGDIQFNGMRFQVSGRPVSGDVFEVEYSDSQNLLNMVGQIVHALKDPSDIPTGDFSAFVGFTLDNLNAAETSVLETRVKIGSRMNVGESSKALNENLVFEGTKIISELRDLDYAEALSDLAFQTFVLEAAQNSFVKISNLSLFNFIR
ncbi:MAG: flagellar hook-associated protein FlgL [Gammaproteobacteria bacterium]|nr:flagellar hook-associated protein FlgL [Gammaproteobacteria bacterium]